jgi:hypothetical protein
MNESEDMTFREMTLLDDSSSIIVTSDGVVLDGKHRLAAMNPDVPAGYDPNDPLNEADGDVPTAPPPSPENGDASK